MKNRKDVEKFGYSALIPSIASLAIATSLMFLILVWNTRTNLGIPQQILEAIRIVMILLSIVVILQVGVLIYKIQAKEKICPTCNNPLPKWRIPKNTYEFFVGGWTCPNCGTKLTWQLRERK